KPVERLLARAGLKKRQISHWVVHSGGKKVIDSIKYNIGLSNHDLRHTRSVLRDFGNVSSGSFLFSLSRLFEEARPVAGDFGVLVAMGPGTSIETGLVQW
ncbi:MAG: type III polyketide synthase, partial [Myxococcales bacterium]|nr:type III polyketide synthase [Myxococcales bacterium]